jgi:hypothetical protein
MTKAGTISAAAPAALPEARQRPVTVRPTLRLRLRWWAGQERERVSRRESRMAGLSQQRARPGKVRFPR